MFGTYGFLTRDITVPAPGRFLTVRRGTRVHIRSTDERRQTVTISIGDCPDVTVAASAVR